MTEQRELLSAADFFQHYSHKEGHYGLVRGEVIEMAPPGWVHGGIAVNIATFLNVFVRQHGLGRVVVGSGYRLESEPDTVRGPDVSFVRRERVPAEGLPRAFFAGVPDLAVEVVSPSDTASQLESKVHDYLRNGTQQVCVVYPDSQRVEVHHSDGSARWYGVEDTLGGGELLPGFSLSVRDVFAQ